MGTRSGMMWRDRWRELGVVSGRVSSHVLWRQGGPVSDGGGFGRIHIIAHGCMLRSKREIKEYVSELYSESEDQRTREKTHHV